MSRTVHLLVTIELHDDDYRPAQEISDDIERELAGDLAQVVLIGTTGDDAELVELGFETQTRPALPGQVVYTATDSPVTITVLTDTVLTDPDHPRVRAACAADGQPWRVEWTATTPIHVQLITLYAILNHDPAAALSAAATALSTTPSDAEPGKPYPAG